MMNYLTVGALIFNLSFPQFSLQAPMAPEKIIEEVKGSGRYIEEALDQETSQETEIYLPQNKELEVIKSLRIPITAYSSTPDQTDSTPFITASGAYVHYGIAAANFLPLGTKVRFPEMYPNKTFVVLDRMNPRYYYHADIWFPTREEAKQFGRRYLKIEILGN